jgi:hypothetical protein
VSEHLLQVVCHRLSETQTTASRSSGRLKPNTLVSHSIHGPRAPLTRIRPYIRRTVSDSPTTATCQHLYIRSCNRNSEKRDRLRLSLRNQPSPASYSLQCFNSSASNPNPAPTSLKQHTQTVRLKHQSLRSAVSSPETSTPQ